MTQNKASARDRHRAATNDAILDTALAMLREEPNEIVSHEAIAARSGISPRTTYRHFPDRGALIRALWGRLRDETDTRWPTTEAAIGPAVRAQFDQFETHTTLVRASIAAAASSTGYQVYGSAEGREAFRESLAPIVDKLSPTDADQLVAICVAIYSAPFWQMLRDRGQLSAEGASDAATWALDAIVAAAHARATGQSAPPRTSHIAHDEG